MWFLHKKKKGNDPVRDFSLHSGERQTGETLDKIRCDHIARYQLIIDTLRENISEPEQLFGLDAFCATGYGSYMITSQLNCTMFGVDASSEAIEHANQYFSNDRTYYANKHFPFWLPENRFDFVTCIESVEHVQASVELIKTLVQSLKKGGLLFLSVPNEELLPLAVNPMHFHHKHFWPGELETIANDIGGIDLLSFYGQNVYKLKDGRMVEPLPDEKMKLVKSFDGQFLFYVFQRKM